MTREACRVSPPPLLPLIARLGEVTRISLRMDSPGGDVSDGIAIYDMLRQHKAPLDVTIECVAAR